MFYLAAGEGTTAGAGKSGMTEEQLANVGKFTLFGAHMDVFDIFILVFTIIIAWAVFRALTARQKNKFAIGFALVSLVVFLLMDVIMFQSWMS